MKNLLSSALLLTSFVAICLTASAQVEGPVPTQVLVNVDAKSTPPADASALTVSVNDHKEPLIGWAPVSPANAQVALLIDDGLRESVGRELKNLQDFVRGLPPGVEVLVGYMQYGRVVSEQSFTTDRESAASGIRLPEGMPGASASPYLCLSDFVKKWPASMASSSANALGSASPHKARFVLMLTNGVDPYNGRPGVMNQDSPYVASAVTDAQRAGVAVYSIYFGDAGMRGGAANFSGQSYLSQLTDGTGGINYYEGTGNPVSMAPYLHQFQHAIGETYVATFNAPASNNPQRDLIRVKFSAPHVKLHAPEEVRVGNQE
jgi:hypothetical protein